MILSRKHLKEIAKTGNLQDIPAEAIFGLPEKVLQFGTGVLLRGLPDYFIDKANKQGIFNGRIVMVKSTTHGDTESYTNQDNLYTLCIRGIEKGKTRDEVQINASISRVLTAAHQWQDILDCAGNPQMQIVISNTTEAGLVLAGDRPGDAPPASFPGKLLAFLMERYRRFNGSAESGMIIIPTELIPDNGTLLRDILVEKSRRFGLEESFIHWLETANEYCSSLVDCIVPGSLPEAEKKIINDRLGYSDDLMIMSEVYRLWAIESGSARSREILSFSRADERVIIAPDISRFRELKLRLLNSAHTLTCGLAVEAGFTYVKQAMEDGRFSRFITRLLEEELVPAVQSESITKADALAFAHDVLDRFRNPFLQHRWSSICLQYSSKMKTRNIQNILDYYRLAGKPPLRMAAGFAGWLLFMRSEKRADGQFAGNIQGREYFIDDDAAEKLNRYWLQTGTDPKQLVKTVLKDTALWETNLNWLAGFAEAVTGKLEQLMRSGPSAVFD
jgi:tagaturonate reductase